MAKQAHQGKKLVLTVLLIVVAWVLGFEYTEYTYLPDVSQFTMMPDAVGRDNMAIGVRWFQFIPKEPLSADDLSRFDVSVRPDFPHTVAIMSERNIVEGVVGPEALKAAEAKLNKIAPGRYELMMKAMYSNEPNIVMTRTGNPLKHDQDYIFEVKLKRFNLFSVLTGKASKTFAAHTGSFNSDEIEWIKLGFTSGAVPTYSFPKKH